MISARHLCALMITNGILVATACYLLVSPFIKDRTRLLGTREARLEEMYAMSLPGWGALIATAFALLTLTILRLKRTKGIAPL